MKKVFFLLTIFFMVLFAGKAFADENVWQQAKSDQYGTKAGGMLGRGLVNAATCFVDLIVQTVQGTQDGPPFIGTLTGLGGGLGCTALRATSGVLDVLTFWVPGFNGIPVSRSYSNCLESEEEAASAAPAEAPAVGAPAPVVVTPQAPVEEPKPKKHRRHHATDYIKK